MGTKRSLMLDDEQLDEKFASKKQQGYFYAKCGEGKTKEQKKWCKMAKEFSDDMTKKDWKKLPEKKKTSEKETIDENKIVSLILDKENPRMTKKGLIEYIKTKNIIKTTSKKEMVSEQLGGIDKNLAKNMRYFKGEKGAIQRVMKYLEMIRQSGLENMMGAYPLLNWTKDDLHRYLFGKRMDLESLVTRIEDLEYDIDDGEDDTLYNSELESLKDQLTIIEYLLDNKQEIRDILIRVALRKSEELDDYDDRLIQRHFENAAKEAFMIWVKVMSI